MFVGWDETGGWKTVSVLVRNSSGIMSVVVVSKEVWRTVKILNKRNSGLSGQYVVSEELVVEIPTEEV